MSLAIAERHPVADRLHAISAELNAFYKEREDATFAMLLAILCREHVFLLGPPGTAKSEMVRHLVRAITGAAYFETLLSRNLPVEKIVGPTNLQKFREDNLLVTNRDGYVTQVHFAFLDEIGKMSPLAGHALLALLNERLWHEVIDGVSVHPAPLVTAFTASNEEITSQSDQAAALDDRLLVRCYVDSVQDNENFKSILRSCPPVNDNFIALADLEDAQSQVLLVDIEGVLEGVSKLRLKLKEDGIEPSTRRWRASMKILRASAFLAGRTTATDEDLAALRFTLWQTADQIDKVTYRCLAASDPWVENLAEIRQIVSDVDAGISERLSDGSDGTAKASYGHDAETKLNSARDRLDTMLMDAGDRRISGFKRVSDFHRETVRRNIREMVGQTDDEIIEQIMSSRLGSGDGGNT